MAGALMALGGATPASGGGGGGGGGPTLQLIPSEYMSTVTDPDDATSQFSLGTGGGAEGFADLVSGTLSYSWLTGGTAADYEVRATMTSGTYTSGTAGSWLSLGSNRTWTVFRGTQGQKSATANFEIRRVSDSVVVAGPAAISITAFVESGG